jgi:hypothetical protein
MTPQCSCRFACVTTDRVVQLFDENGERRDKFSTKPAEANVSLPPLNLDVSLTVVGTHGGEFQELRCLQSCSGGD